MPRDRQYSTSHGRARNALMLGPISWAPNPSAGQDLKTLRRSRSCTVGTSGANCRNRRTAATEKLIITARDSANDAARSSPK